VQSEEWLSPEVLRGHYIDERARELFAQSGDAERARQDAESDVALTTNRQGRQELADDAVGTHSQFEYLRRRGAVPSLDVLDDEGVRAAVRQEWASQPLTDAEFADLVSALQSWRPSTAGWNTDMGEMFPSLVAHTLGVLIRDRNTQATATLAREAGPLHGHPIDVFYNGHDHWNASVVPHHH
jgi:hypothetical protein